MHHGGAGGAGAGGVSAMGLAGAQVALKRSGTQNVLDELNVAEAVRQCANPQQLIPNNSYSNSFSAENH
jgi:hypothetical protein